MRYRIREWIDAKTGRGVFDSHYERLSDKGQARCDQRLLYLRDQPPQNWRDPYAKKMSWEYDKACQGLYEVRFEANDLQQRPMGYFGPGADEFTVVVWVTHKGRRYSTTDFCRVARQRWRGIIDGADATVEVEIE